MWSSNSSHSKYSSNSGLSRLKIITSGNHVEQFLYKKKVSIFVNHEYHVVWTWCHYNISQDVVFHAFKPCSLHQVSQHHVHRFPGSCCLNSGSNFWSTLYLLGVFEGRMRVEKISTGRNTRCLENSLPLWHCLSRSGRVTVTAPEVHVPCTQEWLIDFRFFSPYFLIRPFPGLLLLVSSIRLLILILHVLFVLEFQ